MYPDRRSASIDAGSREMAEAATRELGLGEIPLAAGIEGDMPRVNQALRGRTHIRIHPFGRLRVTGRRVSSPLGSARPRVRQRRGTWSVSPEEHTLSEGRLAAVLLLAGLIPLLLVLVLGAFEPQSDRVGSECGRAAVSAGGLTGADCRP